MFYLLLFLTIGFYSQGQPRRELWFTDDEPVGEFKFEPNRLETTVVQIPYDAYKEDRKVRVVFRNADGSFVAKAGLVLLCLDHKAKGGGGGQSGGREASLLSKLRVGPNPTRGKLSINFHLDKSTSVKISLFDLTGRRVAVLHNGKLTPGKHGPTLMLPEKISSGVYFLIIKADQRCVAKKVILKR